MCRPALERLLCGADLLSRDDGLTGCQLVAGQRRPVIQRSTIDDDGSRKTPLDGREDSTGHVSPDRHEVTADIAGRGGAGDERFHHEERGADGCLCADRGRAIPVDMRMRGTAARRHSQKK